MIEANRAPSVYSYHPQLVKPCHNSCTKAMMAIFAEFRRALVVALLFANLQAVTAEKISKNPTDTITSGGMSFPPLKEAMI